MLPGMVHGYEVGPDFVPWLLTLRRGFVLPGRVPKHWFLYICKSLGACLCFCRA